MNNEKPALNPTEILIAAEIIITAETLITAGTSRTARTLIAAKIFRGKIPKEISPGTATSQIFQLPKINIPLKIMKLNQGYSVILVKALTMRGTARGTNIS